MLGFIINKHLSQTDFEGELIFHGRTYGRQLPISHLYCDNDWGLSGGN